MAYMFTRMTTNHTRKYSLKRPTEKQPFRGISTRVTTGMAGVPPAIVAVAIDISQHEHFNQAFRETLWSFVVLAALASVAFIDQHDHICAVVSTLGMTRCAAELVDDGEDNPLGAFADALRQIAA